MNRLIPLGLLALLVVAGCSGEPSAEEQTDSQHSTQYGLIAVSYSQQGAPLASQLRLTTNAQFVRYNAADRDQVAQLLALPLDPDRDLPDLDQCQLHDLTLDLGEEAVDQMEEPGNVVLLEAGTLQVQTASAQVTLAPKHFPGLLPFISGVVYSEVQSTQAEEPGQVTALSEGGEAVGAFSAQLDSPPLPALVEVDGLVPEDGLLISRARDLALSWDSKGVGPTDTLYLELRYSQNERELALRCRLEDDGHFSLPRELLPLSARSLSLELSRLRRTFFSAGGLDQGELRVTVQDKLELR